MFEEEIKMACRHYKAQRRAKIDKFPEPFRVVQKNGEGMFTRRFTAAAAPDYQVWGQIYGHRPDELERPDTRADGYA